MNQDKPDWLFIAALITAFLAVVLDVAWWRPG